MIETFRQEQLDGVAELVKASNAIAYTSPLNIKFPPSVDIELQNRFNLLLKARASRDNDKIDLFPIQTILVTTGVNRNLDVFLKEEIYLARHSAEDKPINIGHVQTDIAGHITANFMVDANFNIVPDETALADIPDKIHLVTPGVIYSFWEDKAQQARISKIISEIQTTNKWSVSMEALFPAFDYYIMTEKGEAKVIARNEQTSGLTKYLKQYGGSGKIDGGYTIGRILRNITFSGKGIVENPANPESVFLNDMKDFKATSEDVGYIKLYCESNNNKDKGKSTMAEVAAELKTFNIEDHSAFKLLKSEVESLRTAKADLEKQLSETSTKAVTEKISKLENEITSLKANLEDTSAKFKKADEEKEEMKKAKEKAEADAAKAAEELSKVNAEKTKAERTSTLVKAGAPTEEAEKLVADFADLSTEKFDLMIAHISPKWVKGGSAEEAEKKTEEEYKKASKADDKSTAKTDKKDQEDEKAMVEDCKGEKVIETAAAEAEKDLPLGVDQTDSKLESTRADIVNWFGTNVHKNKK